MRNGQKSADKPALIVIAVTAVVALALAIWALSLSLNWPSGRPSAVKTGSPQTAPFDAKTREQVRDFVAEEVERQSGGSLRAFGAYSSGLLAAVSLLIAVAVAVFGLTWWRQTRDYDRLMTEARRCHDEVTRAAKDAADWARDAQDHLRSVQKSSNEAEQAVNEIRKLQKQISESATTTTAHRHFTEGLTYQNSGELDRAIEEYTHSIEAEDSPAAYYNRGLAWGKKGQHDKAVEDYKRAVQLKASGPRFTNLAEALIVCGEYREAKAQIEEALRRGFMTDGEEELIAAYLKGLARALAGEPTAEEETALERCVSRGVKVRGWSTAALDRYLTGLNPDDLPAGAVDAAGRIHAKFKEAVD